MNITSTRMGSLSQPGSQLSAGRTESHVFRWRYTKDFKHGRKGFLIIMLTAMEDRGL